MEAAALDEAGGGVRGGGTTNAGRDGIAVVSIARLILSGAVMLALHVFGV